METTGMNFSWKRVAQLYEYNGPWLKKQTIVYAGISLFTALFFLFAHGRMWQMAIYGTLSLILTFMFIWAPIIFIKGGDSRIIDRLVPASPMEKFVFYMSYLLPVMLIVCFLFPRLAEEFYPILISGSNNFATIKEIGDLMPDTYQWTQDLSVIAAMITCFYFVIVAKKNRVVKAYLWPIVAMSVFSSLGVTTKEAFIQGYNDGVNQNAERSFEEVAKQIRKMRTHIRRIRLLYYV